MKKFLFLLILLICFTMVGCETTTPDDKPSGGGELVTPTPVPTPVPTPEPTPLPPAPTLSAGYCDPGYTITSDNSSLFTIEKDASAGQWTGARLEIEGYNSVYSAFTIVIETTNVTDFTVQLIYYGEEGWTNNVSVHNSKLTDGEHEIKIDFKDTNVVDASTWAPITGYYVKDYDVVAINFSLDTAVDSSKLVNEDATCVIKSLTFQPEEKAPEGDYSDDEVYVPSSSSLKFSDANANRVSTEATFDITKHTNNASYRITPHGMFSSGMCLQRDAINRIWGRAYETNHIAIEFKGKVYYGTVSNGQFEVYLPKMNAGGPYNMTIISEAGRMTISNVYVGEVFLLSGQSNMEFRPQDGGDILKDLYQSEDCTNDLIRMYRVGWSTPEEPETTVLQYSQWTNANKNSIYSFSAVGYIFGKMMQEELGCPVGLICNPVGGSSVEFWLSDANYQEVKNIYKPYTDGSTILTPSLGYNGMLYPLTGLNVRGVVWYQGESNAFGTQQYYDQALEIYIQQCREMFNNEQLSFTVCQLARFNERPLAYSTVNERINVVAEKDPYVVVARNLDQGEWMDIHPKDKHAIGYRAAYETLRNFFNVDLEAPVEVTGYKFNSDGTVTITLSRNANLVNGTNGFEVYVNNAYTYDCNVTINGNAITVSASGEITKVRYGYTCKMTAEIKNDVSKMVTVYDENGFPLDLFLISK